MLSNHRGALDKCIYGKIGFSMVLGLVEIFIDGLAQGMLFALFGVSITLIFGLGDILNLSVGVFAVLAVFGTAFLVGTMPIVPAVLLSIAAIAILGLLVDRSLLSIVYRESGENRILLGIFTTLGLALAIDGLLFIYHPQSVSISLGLPIVEVLGLGIRGSTLVILGLGSVVLLGLYAFLEKTYLGKATRTVFQDETGALLCGIPIRRLKTLIFVTSVAIAGLAGIMFAFRAEVSVGTGFQFTIFAIIISIVGGVRSVTGTVLAGFFLGFVVTFANYWIGAFIGPLVLFAAAVIVLIIKPEQIS